MPKILWLHADRQGCGAYRAYAPAMALQLENSYEAFMLLQHEMALEFDYLRGVSIMVVQRRASVLFKRWYEEAKRRGIKIVFELDDHLWRVPKHNPAYEEWNDRNIQRLLRWQLDEADAVVCSTPPLRDAVIEHAGQPASKVFVAMNHLHPRIWDEESMAAGRRYDNQGKVVIGYQGSMTHNIDFAQALPALRRVLDENPDVILRFFGYVPPAIRDVIPLSRWQYKKGVAFSEYPASMVYLNFDIGIAPLVDSKFNRAKSNIKFLEYSALRIPSVCSTVYPYATTVRHGETGFLAGNVEEWYTALTTLVRDATLRREMAERAHDAVWAEWGYQKHVGAWRSMFDSLVPQEVVR